MKIDDSREASRTLETSAGIAASRRLPPSRCAVVWPRTSARMPPLSIMVTPLRSMMRWRWPPRKSCWMSRSKASAAPPATRGTWGDRTRRSWGRFVSRTENEVAANYTPSYDFPGMPIDIRDALRGFARNRGFVAAAVLSLALGVGANTAIFSVASALLLRPLPYPQADRLVILWNRSPGIGITEDWFSTAQYIDIRNNGGSLEQVGIADGGHDNLTGNGAPERVSTVRLSSNLLPLFGARAQIGRLFTAEEDTRVPANTALLAYPTWVRRYGSDPNVIGRRIELNGRPFEVVGVVTADFFLPHEVLPTLGNPEDPDIVIPQPLPATAGQTRNREDYNIVGRLKPGAS